MLLIGFAAIGFASLRQLYKSENPLGIVQPPGSVAVENW
jgi:hypothetical protein